MKKTIPLETTLRQMGIKKTIKKTATLLLIYSGIMLATIGPIYLRNTHKRNKEPTAELTRNDYKTAAIIEFYNRAQRKSSDEKTVLMYDLDGKIGPDGQKTVDEAFVYSGETFINGNYKFLRDLPVTEWKHYLAPDADKPLIENNITPMNQEQRDFYSKVLNLGNE